MNVLINCNELISPDFVMLEAAIGAEGCWTYHKLRLFLKEQRTDKVYRGKLPGVAAVLRVSVTILEATLDHMPTTLGAHRGQYWQLHEITKELDTLEGRVKGGLKGYLNKGKGKDIIVDSSLKEGESERKPKSEPQKTEVAEDVFLADGELEKLKAAYPQLDMDKIVKELSIYIGSSGKKYKSHYKTLMGFAERRLNYNNAYSPTQSPTPTNNRRPIAVLGADGSINGEIEFNSLPAATKIQIMNRNVVNKILAEEAEKDRLAELNLNKGEITNEKSGNDKSPGNFLSLVSKQAAK